MARPTDPEKLAALRARQARNAANYRARKRAAMYGVDPPPGTEYKRRSSKYRADTTSIVDRARADAERTRQARAAFISSLPDIRNPKSNLRAGEMTERVAPVRKTVEGQRRQASRIRERVDAERMQAVGRARRQQLINELTMGAQSDRLQGAMNRDQQREFQALSERIATAGSQQSLAILFRYAGGQSTYSAAIERIVASPESRDVEEGLSMLRMLAEDADRAAVAYAPSRVGRIRF